MEDNRLVYQPHIVSCNTTRVCGTPRMSALTSPSNVKEQVKEAAFGSGPTLKKLCKSRCVNTGVYPGWASLDDRFALEFSVEASPVVDGCMLAIVELSTETWVLRVLGMGSSIFPVTQLIPRPRVCVAEDLGSGRLS